MQHAHLLTKGMLDDSLIGLFHVTLKPNQWIMKLF